MAKRRSSSNEAATRIKPLPAKLTRPAATGLVRRDRLFRHLDAAARNRIVWICGPGGAGKTSLVSSWIETRGIASLWYRIDTGDADLGTFFHYLRLAVRDRPNTEPLPAFAPANAAAIDVFARRFFEGWFACFDEAVTLVFDNYERPSADSRIGEVLDALLAVMPEHARVVVLSRSSPPAALARWEASPDLVSLAWDQLRFSTDESTALAASWGVQDASVVAPMALSSRGWAAGMVLMLRAVRAGIQVRDGADEAPRGLFNYFATEIVARAPSSTQQFLLRAAFLPDMTAVLAEVLTGEPRAQKILADLHADNFFVERKATADASAGSYEFHPLFREFLRASALQTLGSAVVDDIRRKAATLLEAGGDIDAAAQLLIDAKDSTRLALLIEQHAEDLLRRARFATLRGWLERLPDELIQRSPRLAMWRGQCQLAARDEGWRSSLALAKQLFDESNDVAGAFVVRAWMMSFVATAEECAAIVTQLQALVDRHWDSLQWRQQVQALEQLRNDRRTPLTLVLLRDLYARTAGLFDTIDEPEAKLQFATFVGTYAVACGDLPCQLSLESRIRPLLDAGKGSTRVRASCLSHLHYYWTQCGSADDNRRVLRELGALGDAGGFYEDQLMVWHGALRAALCCRDFAAVARWERLVRPIAKLVPWRYLFLLPSCVQMHLERGDTEAAERDANELHALMPAESPHRRFAFGALAQLALERGDARKAAGLAEQALAVARAWQHPPTIYTSLVLSALAQKRCGDVARAQEFLTDALRHSRQFGVVRCLHIADRFTTEAFVFALQQGIEPDHVKRLIRILEQPPPATDIEEWPWPARVRVLGAPALEQPKTDAVPDSAKGKRQPRKPVELLHFVISRGGEPVAISAATHALWPDSDGDAAKKAFDITLHRLRKLLGADDAVRLDNGRLVLNAQHCWVDAFAFGRLAERIERGEAPAPDEPLDGAMARSLALYRGHFLGDGGDAAWAVAYRDKLRAQFMRLVELTGAHYTASGRCDDAERCYRKALELDPVAERIYRRLMQSLAGRGETAAAIDVYRRCREMLSVLLGTKPSPETAAAYERVRGA